MRKLLTIRLAFFFSIVVLLCSCGRENNSLAKENQGNTTTQEVKKETQKAKITFIELGSVNCIPCRMMQPVMKSAEKKYGDQLKVVFYDVWKPEQQHYARQYGIRLIPTQVFLDANEKEVFRHEGFFSEEELDKFLQSKGLS
ncbi:thioredoxin, partial [candidate division KSB1 bacterium RBG_16_48_16]